MTLSQEQTQALARGEPVNLTIAGIRCVAVREDLYAGDHVSTEDADLPTPIALSRIISDIMAEDDAEDPALDSYQQFKKRQ